MAAVGRHWIEKKKRFEYHNMGFLIQELTTRILKKYIMIIITIMNSNKKVKNKKIFVKTKTPTA